MAECVLCGKSFEYECFECDYIVLNSYAARLEESKQHVRILLDQTLEKLNQVEEENVRLREAVDRLGGVARK